MEIHFYIDPETGQPHIEDHDVTEAEVEDVMCRPGEDRSGRGNTSAECNRFVFVRPHHGFYPQPEGLTQW